MKSPITRRADRPTTAQFGTRRRVLIPLTLGFAVLASMLVMTSRGVLALTFATSSQNFRVYSDSLSGSSLAAYAGPQQTSAGVKGTEQLVVQDVQLHGLCIISTADLPVLGKASMIVTAGEPVDGTTDPAFAPIRTASALVSATSINGDGRGVSSLAVGQSAETLTTGSGPWRGTPGALGIQLDTATIDRTDLDAAGLQIDGQLPLNRLGIKTALGAAEKGSCS
ncbi:DUF6230 family protein [Flexivirga meconopsidis]|uniref:DUF6230 family protein n=1 Tax=Flexivirga meconopsidis TaxID=2977121 RepID=UPI002240BCFB|nr:DUF6230 family protein [Flexivirga meconopsidis]